MRIDLIRWGESARKGRSAAFTCRASPSAHPVGVEKMRIDFRKTTASLVLTGALACAGTCGALDASAATGGASAPAAPGARAKPARKVHPSGIATWFGPGFYGQRTACGQTLTPAVIGVAHRTLACGTLVKVSYAGRSLTMPVLDRGPYSRADWDLTAGAAQALGIADTVRITTRVVGSTANTPTLGLPPASPASALTGGAPPG
jgi:rare lipoprotein A (peptidoglycan hydrolase)